MKIFRNILFSLLILLMPLAALAEPVNINTADAATLAANLNGVGAVKAQEIVAYREANGPFKTADDLLKVKGIGQATLEKNLPVIRLE